ncbi:hypothetical protein B0H17DRAFT_1198693 [Mycena rosella]|uniref:Uncharacterized protein n=1 Tax=Mycena rosella TaxID=1033263 RepID=A0AAD7DQU2_MYCRO|nr:hypothetical protein B0H17DRAFT_1198693 [Mycena rosella]
MCDSTAGTIPAISALLSYGAGGKELYNQYIGQMNWLLQRPHAHAFVFKGGVLSFFATLYNPDLVKRFMEGPSMQVTHYGGRKTILLEKSNSKCHFSADTVGPCEESLLLGHIPGTSAKEVWLWPPPSFLEGWSPHMQGYHSPSTYAVLKNLRDNIWIRKKFEWRT